MHRVTTDNRWVPGFLGEWMERGRWQDSPTSLPPFFSGPLGAWWGGFIDSSPAVVLVLWSCAHGLGTGILPWTSFLVHHLCIGC